MQSSSTTSSTTTSSSSPAPVTQNPMLNYACDILRNESVKSFEEKRSFRFEEIYNTLTLLCSKYNFPLESVRADRIPLGHLNTRISYYVDVTLLHIMVSEKNISAVKLLTEGNSPEKHIPRNVKHVSTNNLLHFCGLWAQSDLKQTQSGQVNSFVNKELMQIILLLSDPTKPDHLPLDVEKSVRHQDGGTHAHSACIYDANDLMTIYFLENQNAYDIGGKNNEKARALSKNPHIDQFVNSLKMAYNNIKSFNPNAIDPLMLYSNACLLNSSLITALNQMNKNIANHPTSTASKQPNANAAAVAPQSSSASAPRTAITGSNNPSTTPPMSSHHPSILLTTASGQVLPLSTPPSTTAVSSSATHQQAPRNPSSSSSQAPKQHNYAIPPSKPNRLTTPSSAVTPLSQPLAVNSPNSTMTNSHLMSAPSAPTQTNASNVSSSTSSTAVSPSSASLSSASNTGNFETFLSSIKIPKKTAGPLLSVPTTPSPSSSTSSSTLINSIIGKMQTTGTTANNSNTARTNSTIAPVSSSSSSSAPLSSASSNPSTSTISRSADNSNPAAGKRKEMGPTTSKVDKDKDTEMKKNGEDDADKNAKRKFTK